MLNSSISKLFCIVTIIALINVSCKDEDEPTPTCNGTIDFNLISTTNSSCGTMVGKIEIMGIGGNGNYQYRLDQGTFQPSGTFENLAPGPYKITVKDDIDCNIEKTVNVISGIKLSNIKSIFLANCAISGCHNGTTNLPNFLVDNVIKENALNIKSRTMLKSMPPSGSGKSLTDVQIANIGCWVDDGAPL